MYWFVAHDVHMSIVSIVDIAMEFELFYLISVVWKETERETETKRDRETDRETDRDRQRHTQKDRDSLLHTQCKYFFLLHNFSQIIRETQ